MIANLSGEDIYLIEKAKLNPKSIIFEVDNDVIYVINTETNELEGQIYLYGQDLLVAILRYIGVSAEFA